MKRDFSREITHAWSRALSERRNSTRAGYTYVECQSAFLHFFEFFPVRLILRQCGKLRRSSYHGNGNCLLLCELYLSNFQDMYVYELFSGKFTPIASSTTLSSDVSISAFAFSSNKCATICNNCRYYALRLTNRYTNVTSEYLMNFERFARTAPVCAVDKVYGRR